MGMTSVSILPGGNLVADSVTAVQVAGKIGDPANVDRLMVGAQAPMVAGALVVPAAGLLGAGTTLLGATADIVAPTAPAGAGVTSTLGVAINVPGAGDLTLTGYDNAGAPAADAPIVNYMAIG